MPLTRPKRKLPAFSPTISAVFVSLLAAGCAASHTTVVKPPANPALFQTASKADLVARYDSLASAVKSLNWTVTITLTAGSAYTGVIKQYHEVKGFILAQKPADIRVIGQAPVVGTNIFDMVSDGETFRISIPSQHKFLTGSAKLERQSAKPIENLRPQHLIGAIFWEPIPAGQEVLIEEAGDGAEDYVLTVLRHPAEDPAGWEIGEKVWFDRTDLNVIRRQTYEAGGKLASDVAYSSWDAFPGAQGANGPVRYPRQVVLSRPGNDYKLQIGITKAAFNETITADRFELKQPEGEELVKVGEEAQDTKPDMKPAEPKN